VDTKGLCLTIEPWPTHAVVHVDADKARQVLLNLLSNAVKFTERGGDICVGCELTRDRPGAVPAVVVHVRDTGRGIPQEKLGAIFEPFVQVDAGLTRIHEGTGLGLAISRELARGMGSDLTVQSEVGVGSTFALVLPMA
jgi:signal transduction histidine kinase